MAAVPENLLPRGTLLGDYRVEQFLRDGGMADVHLGIDTRSDDRVAIKVLKPHVASHHECLARFDREAELMGRLRGCPNIVEVLATGVTSDARPYLVMEFVRGQDLDDVLLELQSNDERMSIIRACQLVRDIAFGIATAHRLAIVHRDLKPANVMVEQRRDGSEIAKVLDFGVSADLAVSGTAQGLTVFGSVIGTPGYMAPEQSVGLRASPSFDIYALGVILHELLTGVPPPEQGFRAHDWPNLRAVRPETPEPLLALVEHALAVDATRRMPSVDAFLGDLEATLRGFQTPAEELRRWAEPRPATVAGVLKARTATTPAIQTLGATRSAPTVIVHRAPTAPGPAPGPVPAPGPLQRAGGQALARTELLSLALFSVAMLVLGGLSAYLVLSW